jgi:hypothetical protein
MAAAIKKYFSKKNIASNKFDASEVLAEQAVHCLELVSELVESGLSFQFKGGNSLLLILEKPRRFSIDVDIATDETRERIEKCLDSIIEKGTFTKWTKRQHKTKPWLPLSSYYCHYTSQWPSAEDAFIMLDAQLTRSPYATRFAPVHCGNLYKSKAKAEIPLASSIIGDKLLTLGPATLGIPTGKGKEAQRLKHVYDIALLLGTLPPLHEIRESFKACVRHENKLQEKSVCAQELLSDTLSFCSTVKDYADIPEIHRDMSPVCVENVKGLLPFAAHLFEKNYAWKNLKVDMAKVALVMSAVCKESVTDETFKDILTVVDNYADTQFYWDKLGKWIGN